ncbi:MAG: hypothetical protein ABI882_11335, partial [Acidobacteriota bacterium]
VIIDGGERKIDFVVIEPANITLRGMSLEAPPSNFYDWRNRWEYGHAVRLVLHLLSFTILVLSMLSPTSDKDWRTRASSGTIVPTRDRAQQWHRSS